MHINKKYASLYLIIHLFGQRPRTYLEHLLFWCFQEYQALVFCPQNEQSYYYNAIMFLAETGLRAEELAIKKTDIHIADINVACNPFHELRVLV